ncbi:MAG: oligosaccharide flippase family protein [bacterium]
MNDHSFLDNSTGLVELRRKSLASIGSMLRRQFIVYGILFSGNIVLAWILDPQVFGFYAITAFVVQFFSTFSDVGIGAALIQKKEPLTKEELSAIFWLQQILVAVAILLICATASLAFHIYPSLPLDGTWLIRGMALSLFFSSLRTVPAILMERSLDFSRIAWVDIAESLIFQVVAICFALTGMGVWSFIIAAITRSFSGTTLVYILSSWRPTLSCRFGTLKDLLRFGLPYQANNIVLFIKDSVTPLFVGIHSGAAAVGFVNWGRDFAFSPMVFSRSFGRVAFPAFSRLQRDPVMLGRAVDRSIRMITLIMFPVTAILFALGPELTRLIFSDKWLPGIVAFYFFCTSPFVVGIMLPLYSAILALGEAKTLLKMSVLLLLLEWGMGVPFVILFGFSGVAFSQPVIAVIFFVVYKRVLDVSGVPVHILRNIRFQCAAAILVGAALKSATCILEPGPFSVIALSASGCIAYLLLVLAVQRCLVSELYAFIREILGATRASP